MKVHFALQDGPFLLRGMYPEFDPHALFLLRPAAWVAQTGRANIPIKTPHTKKSHGYIKTQKTHLQNSQKQAPKVNRKRKIFINQLSQKTAIKNPFLYILSDQYIWLSVYKLNPEPLRYDKFNCNLRTSRNRNFYDWQVLQSTKKARLFDLLVNDVCSRCSSAGNANHSRTSNR